VFDGEKLIAVHYNKNVLNEYIECVIGYIIFGPFVDMKKEASME